MEIASLPPLACVDACDARTADTSRHTRPVHEYTRPFCVDCWPTVGDGGNESGMMSGEREDEAERLAGTDGYSAR